MSLVKNPLLVVAAHDNFLYEKMMPILDLLPFYLGYGQIKSGGVRPGFLQAKLKDDRVTFLLVMSGSDQDWMTLDLTHEASVKGRCGVVVATDNDVVWQRVSGYKHLSFVFNAHQRARPDWGQLFPKLVGTARIADTSWQHVAERISERLAPIAPIPFPYSGANA